tara:strand:- start:792 stop:1031 length:240 start_codon:yes stop_codon:yes gene_type:complete
MKDRLNKTLNRLKKGKNSSESFEKENKLTAYEIKIFRSLREKYDLSLEKNISSESGDKKLSSNAEVTLKRIENGESFEP